MTTATKTPRTLTFTPNTDDASPITGLLTLNCGKVPVAYVVQEFPTGHPGRGFQLTKVGGDSCGYACFLSLHGAAGDSCECPDSLYRHRACKHRLALRKLLEMGRI